MTDRYGNTVKKNTNIFIPFLFTFAWFFHVFYSYNYNIKLN